MGKGEVEGRVLAPKGEEVGRVAEGNETEREKI